MFPKASHFRWDVLKRPGRGARVTVTGIPEKGRERDTHTGCPGWGRQAPSIGLPSESELGEHKASQSASLRTAAGGCCRRQQTLRPDRPGGASPTSSRLPRVMPLTGDHRPGAGGDRVFSRGTTSHTHHALVILQSWLGRRQEKGGKKKGRENANGEKGL